MPQLDFATQLASVIARTIATFGNDDEALKWLSTPNSSLDGSIPLMLCFTPDGIANVELTLQQQVQGVDRGSAIVLIGGPPAVGKTYLAEHLEQKYGIPRFTKDDFKEAMFDILRAPPIEDAHLFGRCAFAFLNIIMEILARHATTHIIDACFNNDIAAPFFNSLIARSRARVIQIHLHCDRAVLVTRFMSRQGSQHRHPCHLLLEQHSRIRDALLDGTFKPLEIDCDLVEVDTTCFDDIDYARVYKAIEATGRVVNR